MQPPKFRTPGQIKLNNINSQRKQEEKRRLFQEEVFLKTGEKLTHKQVRHRMKQQKLEEVEPKKGRKVKKTKK